MMYSQPTFVFTYIFHHAHPPPPPPSSKWYGIPSYMDAIFELVVHEEAEIWTSLPHFNGERLSYCSSQVRQFQIDLLFLGLPYQKI